MNVQITCLRQAKMPDATDDHTKLRRRWPDWIRYPHDGLTKGKIDTRNQHDNEPSHSPWANLRGPWANLRHANDFGSPHEVPAETKKTQPTVEFSVSEGISALPKSLVCRIFVQGPCEGSFSCWIRVYILPFVRPSWWYLIESCHLRINFVWSSVASGFFGLLHQTTLLFTWYS